MGKMIIAVLVMLALAASLYYLVPRLPIMTGYASKVMCSCVFIGQREEAEIRKAELNFFPIKYVSTKIDREKKTVKASVFFGLNSSTAMFRKGEGCALVKNAENVTQKSGIITFNDTNQLVFSRDSAAGVDFGKLDRIIDEAFIENTPGKLKNTRSLVVVRNGKIIAEKYAEGLSAETPVMAWSMAKSVTNALVGIMVKQGKMDVQKTPGLSEWENDSRKKITYHDLLQMASGLQWDEEYGSISDPTKMLYKSYDVYNYAIDKPSVAPVGEVWNYSSGSTNILAGSIRRILNNDEAYLAFPQKELFEKLGIKALIETDEAGNFIGSSYCMTNTRNWAKLGMLYLNDGVWNGERILPEGWVKYSLTPTKDAHGIYGAQIWLNNYNEKTLQEYKHVDVPKDMFYFRGFQGQRTFIIPSHNLIVVRTGITGVGNFDFNLFLKEILVCIK